MRHRPPSVSVYCPSLRHTFWKFSTARTRLQPLADDALRVCVDYTAPRTAYDVDFTLTIRPGSILHTGVDMLTAWIRRMKSLDTNFRMLCIHRVFVPKGSDIWLYGAKTTFDQSLPNFSIGK